MAKKSNKSLMSSQIRETETPSKQLKLSDLISRQGSSGTYIVHGFLEGDYNPDLSGQRGLEKYDEMRKADAQVNAVLEAMGLPIRSTEWYIEAGKNEDGETDELCEEYRAFVEEALFRKMEQAWDDHIREVLTMLPFGFCAKEKVYTLGDDNKIWLKGLEMRKQVTIYKWEQEDGTAGITQILPTPVKMEDGKLKVWTSVPASKILLFSYKREGDNYAGISVLRSAYRHWYIKDVLYKFDAIRHERQSVGVPYIELPDKATEEDRSLAIQILKDLRANEQTGVVIPPGWKFGFSDLQATNVSDVWKSIEHHNQMIAKNVLAMFMEIVGGENGSRSLSEDQSDFFLLSLEAVAKQIDDIHSRFCIPELLDLNFDVPATSYYPRLAHKKLGSVDYNTFSSVLSTLISAGVVTVDDPLEDFTRKLLDLPSKIRDLNDEEEEEMPGEMEPALDENGDPLTDEDGNQLDIDGNPIETVAEDEDVLDDEDNADLDALDEELADVEVTDEDIAAADEEDQEEEEIDGEVAPFAEVDGIRYVELGGEYHEVQGGVVFRKPMSAETKKKISEALKKGGSTDLKTAVAGRKARRMRSLTQRSLRKPKANKSTRAQQQTKDPHSPLFKKAKPASSKVRQPAAKKKAKGMKKSQIKSIKDALAKAKGNPKVLARLKARIQKLRPPKKAPKVKAQKTPKGRVALKKKRIGAVRTTEDSELSQAHLNENTGHSHDDATQSLYEKFVACCDWEQIVALQNAVERDASDPEPRARPWRFNDIETQTWRPLTFAEKKVNFSSLKNALNNANSRFEGDVEKITNKQKEDILAQVKRAVEANDIAAVGKIKAKYTGDLAKSLTDIQQEMFEAGKKSVAAEIGVKVPPTAREISGALRVQNDKIVDKFVTDMESAAASAVSQTVARHGGSISSTGTSEAVQAAADAVEKVVKQGKGALNTLSVIGTLNLGRSTIYERYPEEVVAMQYSAIIDERTTDHCLSLDGRVVKAGSPEFYLYSPPQHYNCRSIWVEILRDEDFVPEETGIPSKITPAKTIDTFEELIAPVVLPNSPAVKLLREEIDERKKKIEEYKDSGMYQNRIDTHQARIDALEQSLEDTDE